MSASSISTWTEDDLRVWWDVVRPIEHDDVVKAVLPEVYRRARDLKIDLSNPTNGGRNARQVRPRR
ncbi:hypothetical protein CG51_05975 [Haematobacter missouriensis]|uniref:Uncharacterized protein n=1 Tax=Haematobacter missouriensis TaxID=366616 RepID=A0A212AQQ4_9RHOB|nr:hypothetical protein [Haematobacter missouriensis]KFI31048.1 hypothetical protein CG51_05975 [Haematobacter missouriensis]OWJ73904.1 hypothetical protein CDV53_14335 [Haematobacter missouriensis]OWJ83799.1 hypothetical protein CDV52_09830 [Haematobacter missouriensis]